MTMFKTCKIIRMSTDEVQPVIGMIATTNENKLQVVDETMVKVYKFHQEFGDFVPAKPFQHLYVLSDDEIKEGDWYYWSVTKTIGQFKKENLIREPRETDSNTRFKIIATTDTSIIYHDEELLKKLPSVFRHGRYGNGPETQYKIPQLSESFIQEYCERGGVDEVDVEYKKVCHKPICDNIQCNNGCIEINIKLWVSPENTIHAVIPSAKMITYTEALEAMTKAIRNYRQIVTEFPDGTVNTIDKQQLERILHNL